MKARSDIRKDIVMKLYTFHMEALASGQSPRVSDGEIAGIKKKIRYHNIRISWVVFTAILMIAGIYSLFDDTGLLPVICVMLPLSFAVTVSELKDHRHDSCYATVTEKKIRYAKRLSRTPHSIVGYEHTKDEAEISQNPKDFYPVYFCSVTVNGQAYEDVCCYPEDFPEIEIGNPVIVSTLGGGIEVVVYAAAEAECNQNNKERSGF